MKLKKIKSAILSLWLLSALIYVFNFGFGRETSFAQTKTGSVKEIENYKNWTKVNAAPHLMPERVAALCAVRRSPSGVAIDGTDNPHRDKYFTVYVNDIGRAAMLEKKNPKFPKGSVIVKEKLSDETSRTPELLTVMIKQKKGYNPENGDWEYLVVDGTGKTVEERGALQNCQACHAANKKTDYIFRTYLPEAIEKKLK